MRSHWRFALDIRRCLRFDPGLRHRVSTWGLRAVDFEERVVSLMRWEDADGICAHVMRLHRVGLTLRAARKHYHDDFPWDAGPCWPSLPTELQELPDCLMHGLWWEPTLDPFPGEHAWEWMRFDGAGYSLAMRLPQSHAAVALAGNPQLAERRRCWLIRYRCFGQVALTLLLVRREARHA